MTTGMVSIAGTLTAFRTSRDGLRRAKPAYVRRAPWFLLSVAALAGAGACERRPHARASAAAAAATPFRAPASVPAPMRPALPKPAAEPEPPRGTEIALLYSSNLRGEYEPCG